MIHKKFNFNFYNTNFYGQYWQPEFVKGVVVLVHGMGEHSNRYTHIVEKLTEHHFGVITFDHFGHGKTLGKRGHNPNFDAVLESVSQVVKKADAIFKNKPIFLYGHSMGGNVVINYVLQKTHSLKGVIASSPFLRLAFKPPTWKLSLGKILQKIMPCITLANEIDSNHISRDEYEVQKYRNDPLVHNKISPNFSILFINSGEYAIKNVNKLQIPMLLLHGTHDKITDYKATEEFSNHSKKTILKLYDGGYHELHNDLCKEQVISDIIHWLQKQV